MKLRRKEGASGSGSMPDVNLGTGLFGRAVNRRTFLRHSGVTAGGAALATVAAPAMVSKVRAAELSPKSGVDTEIKLSVCTHCSVGCGVVAEVQDGVWTGQEPDYDSCLLYTSDAADE